MNHISFFFDEFGEMTFISSLVWRRSFIIKAPRATRTDFDRVYT